MPHTSRPGCRDEVCSILHYKTGVRLEGVTSTLFPNSRRHHQQTFCDLHRLSRLRRISDVSGLACYDHCRRTRTGRRCRRGRERRFKRYICKAHDLAHIIDTCSILKYKPTSPARKRIIIGSLIFHKQHPQPLIRAAEQLYPPPIYMIDGWRKRFSNSKCLGSEQLLIGRDRGSDRQKSGTCS